MKFSIFFSNGPVGFYKNFICLWLVLFGICPALAYDNSVAPQFEIATEARTFAWISIHPDSERWLITECTDRIEPPKKSCYVFVYNHRTKAYQRLDLPSAYQYSQAQYSPTGQQIIAVRKPYPGNESHEELARVAGEAQFLLMGADGQKLQILNIPKGRVQMPALSPDETKIAYWSAGTVRPAGSKTFMANFDLHEYDLREGTSQLFSGQYKFFLVGRLQYKNADQIVAIAYAPLKEKLHEIADDKKFNSSMVHCFDRKNTRRQDPCLTEIPHASHPSFDVAGNLYLRGQHGEYGISLYRISPEGNTQSWRTPPGISYLAVAPSGAHAGFIYSDVNPRTASYRNALGYFDFSEERWIPLSLPPPESAVIVPLVQ